MSEFKNDIEINIEEPKHKNKLMKIFIGISAFIFISVCISSSYEKKIHKLEERLSNQNTLLAEKDRKIETLNAKVTEAKPWLKMREEEQQKIEEEIKAQEEAEKKQEEEKIAKLTERQRKIEEEEQRLAYENSPSYKDLSANPDKYMLFLAKFKGKVIQVTEGNTQNSISVAVDGNYSNVLLVEYNNSLVSEPILKNDQVTVYGRNMGVKSYTSVKGTKIKVPSMIAEELDM